MGIVAKAKGVKAKDFPIFQPRKKENSPPLTRNRSCANCVRSVTSLQTLIKNVQELAKEEGEESEAKLREVIEILVGDHLRHCRRLARLLGGDFLEVQILAFR